MILIDIINIYKMLYYVLNLLMTIISLLLLFIGYPLLLFKLYFTVLHYLLLPSDDKCHKIYKSKYRY